MPETKRIHPEIRRRARSLRRPLTPAEQKLWRVLRNRQLLGYKFRRQHPIGHYICDFYCAELKLVVEIDGSSHSGREEYDAIRTGWLEGNGCRVIRFRNDEVLSRLNEVAAELQQVCEELSRGDTTGS